MDQANRSAEMSGDIRVVQRIGGVGRVAWFKLKLELMCVLVCACDIVDVFYFFLKKKD